MKLKFEKEKEEKLRDLSKLVEYHLHKLPHEEKTNKY